METAQDRIDRLRKEIESEEYKQKHCQHLFNDPVRDFETTKEPTADFSRGLVGHGSDAWYETIWVDKTTPRWSRTCKHCGKKEYTYTQKTVRVEKEPDFGN